ncbi:hydrogenase iron-sulfur subunit [Halarsenatibacter silvermanii]|uniref:Coenzyme F420-reducing hydrogenase, delta subunit n=1 Tax=Halarsenatibacter silvermanii TaxID=321763 RepID=A0A1G9MD45_9FIRM|nr:hydrogenase iron-sulfur subunit [Halarsenatibacter silvermanii]SDL71837.1 Coenzyme F420-reducing hydrogenase, delta subunit [Halarsenatibacter silvermanii]
MSVKTGSDQNKKSTCDDFEPQIVAFCCKWCSYAGADLAGTSRLKYPSNIRIIKVPCSCRVKPEFILRAFQRGSDGVIVAGCHPGDCHYMTGNYYTRRRLSLLRNQLDFAGINPERFELKWISASEGRRFARVMSDFTEKVSDLGKNRKLRDFRWKN